MTMVMTMVVINSDCSRNFCLLASTRGLFYRPFERMGLETMTDLPDILGMEVQQDPAVFIRALQLGADLQHYGRFDPPFYIVHRYGDVERVLREPDTFISGRGQGPTFTAPAGVVSDPPDHTFYRRLVQDAFQPAAIAALEPRLVEIAGEALASVDLNKEWDLHDTLAFPLPIRIICEILGIPTSDIWQFKQWSDISVAALASGNPAAFADQVQQLSTYVLALLREKRRAPDDTLMSRIALGQRDGLPIPDSEAVSLTSQMFVAGNETTTSLITNFVWRMCRFNLWEDFAEDRIDLELAINESLRFDPPLLALFRTTAREVSIGGTRIPAGAKVMTHYGAANRDPTCFEEPHRFIPERRGPRALSFGLGIHSCLGKELARLEARVALQALRAHCPGLRLVNDGVRIPPFLFWGRCKLPVRNT